MGVCMSYKKAEESLYPPIFEIGDLILIDEDGPYIIGAMADSYFAINLSNGYSYNGSHPQIEVLVESIAKIHSVRKFPEDVILELSMEEYINKIKRREYV